MSKFASKKSAKEIAEDIDTKVTNIIIAKLEQGSKPWETPWFGSAGGGGFPIRVNGEPYQGVNVILLWIAAAEKGYRNPRWMGFNQAKALGGSVRKGEKGTMIVFYSPFIPKAEKVAAAAEGRDPNKAFMLKSHNVWNVEQIDGLDEKFYLKDEVPTTDAQKIERIDHAEAFFKATGSKVVEGTRAAYIPSEDYIEMPPFAKFAKTGPVRYYSTLGHEHIHWTGAKTRLDRAEGMRASFGKPEYAAEELVAEIGAAMLCARLGIDLIPRDDHVDYIAHWLKALKDDKKFFMTAASQAQKAVKLLAGETSEVKADVEEEKEAA